MNHNIIFISELAEVKKSIQRIWVTCCECGRRELAFWVGQSLDGYWMADGANWSEVFQDWLPDPKSIRCSECLAGIKDVKTIDRDSGL